MVILFQTELPEARVQHHASQADSRLTLDQSRTDEVPEDDTLIDQSIDSNEIRRWSALQRAKLPLMVFSPVACFWALNLSSAANMKTRSVTLRMYTTRLVCMLLESAVQLAAESKLDGAGRRTKFVLFSAIFGLATAVLTTISQIDSRADGECDWQAARSSLVCTFSVWLPSDNETSALANGQAATQFSWCCAMVRDGDFLSRPAILTSAAMACAAPLWACLAAALTASPFAALAGGGGLAAGSAALLVWGARGDENYEWLLFLLVWMATLSTPVALLSAPLPFWYDGVTVTAGIVGGTAYLRRALAAAAALAELAVLPSVRGGALLAASVAMVARVILALGLSVAAPVCVAARARAAAARAAEGSVAQAQPVGGPGPGGPARGGGRPRIAAAHVFEFDAAGPHARWRWIRKDGVRRERFAVRPLGAHRAAESRPPISESPGGRDVDRREAEIRLGVVAPLPRSESL